MGEVVHFSKRVAADEADLSKIVPEDVHDERSAFWVASVAGLIAFGMLMLAAALESGSWLLALAAALTAVAVGALLAVVWVWADRAVRLLMPTDEDEGGA